MIKIEHFWVCTKMLYLQLRDEMALFPFLPKSVEGIAHPTPNWSPVPTALSHCCGHVIPGGQRGETEHEVVLEDRLWIG